MSVDVQTSPTSLRCTDFTHPQWKPIRNPSCNAPEDADGTKDAAVFSETEQSTRSVTLDDSSDHPRRHTYSGPRKRRLQHQRGHFQAKRRRNSTKSHMILPCKFLLGGNIRDPLNLNGLSESDEITPESSPLPTSHRDQVSILIPPNISDPLNLNESDDDANDDLFETLQHKQKKRHKRRSTKEKMDTKELIESSKTLEPLNIEVDQRDPNTRRGSEPKVSPAIPKDKIVSPVIPQIHSRAAKRRRTVSETQPSGLLVKSILKEESVPETSNQPESPEVTKTVPKFRKPGGQHPKPKKSKHKETKFIHGNYNRYYGYRNPAQVEDERIKLFSREWFEEKDVLDVGCNTGHVTLTLARDFLPKKIVGVDIDGYLVGVARKNIRNYLVKDDHETDKYPVSMARCYGPLSRRIMDLQQSSAKFPANVAFRQGDFVLESDELLEVQKPEYDVIMALSVTKWIHLNHGDAALKRTFKRFYRMLRPGGKLILEPQGWTSYGKRKKLTDTIFKNYQGIRFRPEQFRDFLLSRHVGFTDCEQLDVPFNKAKGFRRPIYVFTKQSPSEPTVTFDLPIRLAHRPTPVRPDFSSSDVTYAATPNSIDSYTSRVEFSAPGTPATPMAPGTPATPGGRSTPCSQQSCTECKRRIENGFTPNSVTESPFSIDYCSQCSGEKTPGSGNLTPYTPGSHYSGVQTPGSQYSTNQESPWTSTVTSPDKTRLEAGYGPTPVDRACTPTERPHTPLDTPLTPTYRAYTPLGDPPIEVDNDMMDTTVIARPASEEITSSVVNIANRFDSNSQAVSPELSEA